ncbi:MAG: hypothetical protein WAM99_23225, partial [Xanthobacteraceae bacterium]
PFPERGENRIPFPRRLRARVLPTPLSKFLRSPIASCLNPAVGPVFGSITLRHSLRLASGKKERKRNADRRILHETAPADAAAREASRARLSAFHHGTCGGD